MTRLTLFLCTLLMSTGVLADNYYRYQNTAGGTLFTNKKTSTLGADWRLIHRKEARSYTETNDVFSSDAQPFAYNRTSVSSSGTLGFTHFSERQRLTKRRDPSCGQAKVSRSPAGLTTISIRACEPKAPPAWAARNNLYASNTSGFYSGPSRSEKKSQFNDLITQAAQRYQVDEKLVHAVIQTESAYNAHAVSSAGAVGLMQLMPGTARQYGAMDRSDPDQNINAGTKYLRYLLDLFNSNMHLAVAAYNAGENAVMKYNNSIPPYPETRNYVRQVLALYNR